MQKLKTRLLAIGPLALFFAACGSGATTGSTKSTGAGGDGGSGGASADSCVVSAAVRGLLEEIIAEDLNAATDVAKGSSPTSRGFAIQLPGSKEGYTGKRTINTDCVSDNTEITQCQSQIDPLNEEFWMVHDRCARFRCEPGSDKVALVDTYLTQQPITSPTDKHKFTYDTTDPTGTATFDPNPIITWRIDLTDPAAIQVTSKIAVVARITEPSGDIIELSHTGSTAVTMTDTDVSLATLELLFSGLLKGGEELTVSAQVDASGAFSGDIKAGSDLLAIIEKDFTFSWQGNCAP
jgi:hypothetical protein